MKKTLAAVLAAAMALSTASVVLAADNNDADAVIGGDSGTSKNDSTFITIGKEYKADFAVGPFGDDSANISTADLGKMIDKSWAKVTVRVVEGRANLDKVPTVTEEKGVARLKVKFSDNYKPITADKDPVKAVIKVDITFTKDIYWDATDGFNVDKVGGIPDGMKKGDTVHVGEFTFKSGYYETDDYGTDMTFTATEVSNRETVIMGERLSNEVLDDTLNLYFGDTAVWTGKVAVNQKNINVYYDVDEIDTITNEYPAIDFEFITFRGAPSFAKTGEMTFNAIGDKKTVVYTWDGEALTPVSDIKNYDPTYNTITVKNVKKLGTFVVASDVLEEEEPDEPAEPVSSAPVVEEPEEDENPKTGAC